MAGIREGVPADQQRLKNRELKTLNRLGALVGHGLHIHRHLRCGVVGIENQLGAQEFHTFHRLNQLTVLKGQALGGLQAQGRTTALLDGGQLGEVGCIGNGVLLNRTKQ